MLPLLKRAVAVGQPTTIKQIQPLVAADLKLTQAQLAELLPSGTQGVFHNRLHWAKKYMTHAGLVRSTKFGHFEPTKEGVALIKKGVTELNNSVLDQYPAFRAWRTKGKAKGKQTAQSAEPGLSDEATPEERIEAARKELEASLQAELLDRVRQMEPSEFEALIISLLVRMGYGQGREEMAQALGGSGDGGVDGVVYQDPLGLDRVYIQAKRYKDGNTVGPGAMNSFIGALNIQKANKGLFVTASSFTKQAVEHATKSSTHVVLVDGQRLAELMVRHSVGVTVRDTVDIKALDESFFGD